nr:hypothetical protein [Endozoicomonas sp.]
TMKKRLLSGTDIRPLSVIRSPLSAKAKAALAFSDYGLRATFVEMGRLFKDSSLTQVTEGK